MDCFKECCWIRVMFVVGPLLFCTVHAAVIAAKKPVGCIGLYNKHCNQLDTQLNCECEITDNTTTVLHDIKRIYITTLNLQISQELQYFVFNARTFSPDLKSLSIVVYCPFYISSGTFAGLTKLQTLQMLYVATNKARSPTFGKGWIIPLSASLTSLSFRASDISGFPTMQFCNLHKLKELDLSAMGINNIVRLGIICNSSDASCTPCLPKLTKLDISNNPISSLGTNFTREFPAIQDLHLSACFLSNFHLDEVCSNSPNIRILDISSNKLDKLPLHDPCNCSQLQVWLLQDNQLQNLSLGLFLCTQHLTELNMTGNLLSLTTLLNAALNTLTELVKLDLSYNKIDTLESATIGNMTELEEFSCSGCGLLSIDEDSFVHLKKLKTLTLDKNSLHVIGRSTFSQLQNLQRLDLSENHLNVSSFLTTLPSLEELYLRHNSFTEFLDFSATPTRWTNLSILILEGNRISEIVSRQLSGLKNLKMLSLAFNDIADIPDNTFSNSDVLETLYLHNNKIRHIGFNHLPILTTLRLDNNLLPIFPFVEHFMYFNLRFLNLSNNSIDYLGFRHNSGIQWLDLSWNNISNIGFSLHQFPHLKVMNLAHNKLRTLKEGNYLTTQTRPKLYLRGNPLHCDCQIEWLLDTNANNGEKMTKEVGPGYQIHYYAEVPDLDEIHCVSTTLGGNASFSALTRNDLLCAYKMECDPWICHCCHKEHCHCQGFCYPECSCHRKPDQSVNIMNCTSRALTSLPSELSIYLRSIYLDGNNLNSLNSLSLNFPQLERLFVNNSNIQHIETGAFQTLRRLQLLDLHQNHIQEIQSTTFKNLAELEELYLQDNAIHFIDDSSFSQLPQLQTLWLHGNNLTSMDLALFDKLYSLTALTLHGNHWSCDCEFGPLFQDWLLRSTSVKIPTQIYCHSWIRTDKRHTVNNIALESKNQVTKTMIISGPFTNQSVIDFDFSACTNVSVIKVVEYHHIKSITEVISLAGVFAVSVIITLLVYSNRLLLRVWFYNKYGIFWQHDERDHQHRPYDLFIASIKKDEKFVLHGLLPKLEEENISYKVCLECRDWPPGSTRTDTIIAAVQQSKRTILLVSENHLDTQWCEYSFDAAHYQVLADKQIRLILVLTDIELQSRMTRAMKLYMKTDTFLVIGEKWFWKKLRYYLADNPRGADHVVGREFRLMKVY